MDIEKEKIMERAKDMIKEGYYTVNYIEGYIDALFDWDLIDDNGFEILNKLLETWGK